MFASSVKSTSFGTTMGYFARIVLSKESGDKKMIGKQHESIHEIDRLAIELIDQVAETSSQPKPVEYSGLIIDLRDFITNELDRMDDDELEYPF